ncbi:MAG TPA: SET domain-containing protein-lysine N-methyltransferase [Candidatus Binatia bacterium]
MKTRLLILMLNFTVIFIASGSLLPSDNASGEQVGVLKINREYDKRTMIKKSLIPNGGNGLFAAVKIKKGEVIGELGGRLVADNDESLGNHYIASIPKCAWKESHPYKYIDSKSYGANVSRINFAPSKINGIDTNFQNAAVKQLCTHPYFVFLALKDIEPGAEIWASYGPHYEYDKFMGAPEVRDFFCSLLKLDCREKFTYLY